MKHKKAIIIVITVVALIAVFAGISFYRSVKTFEASLKNGIGKNIYITIHQNEIVDYKTLLKSQEKKYNFDLWSQKEREKLVEFMKSNNYIIEPGSYVINQASSFENAKNIFRFSEKK